MKNALFALGIGLSLTVSSIGLAQEGGGAQLAASAVAQAGIAYPGGTVAEYLKEGTAYRLNLFGGARLPRIAWLGAVGLGIDFTYSEHQPRDGSIGFAYRRFLWDWLFIPVTFADILSITPGLAWIVTDVKYPAVDIEQTSIRPAGVLTVGLAYPIVSRLSLRADLRGELPFRDREKRSNGTELDLTGQFVSWFAGLQFKI